MNFDHFTEKAQKATQLSLAIKERYRHMQIDVEHTLLAFLEQPFGTIPMLLSIQQIDAKPIEDQLDGILKAKKDTNIFRQSTNQIFITPRVRDMLIAANDAALGMHDTYISTEHMFLGMLAEKDTPLAKLLASAGVTSARVQAAMKELRNGTAVTDPKAEDRYSLPSAG